MKCECGKIVPEKRADMGYKNCVDCSTVEKYGAVDVIYHKTGNTIEILSAEDARKINELTKRRGFGSIASMRSGSGGGGISVGASRNYPTRADFEKVGEEAMKEYEAFGVKEAIKVIDTYYSKEKITPLHRKNLIAIFDHLENPVKVEEKTVYWKPEVTEPKPEIDPEIEEAMRQWKWWR
jgi:hypothetical protein